MRWVKEILPPRVRLSWLLITIRLSASSLAGTARTLVAVGTASEAFMFLTTALAAPRSGMTWPSTSAPIGAAGFAAREVVPAAGLASVPTTVPEVLVGPGAVWVGWATLLLGASGRGVAAGAARSGLGRVTGALAGAGLLAGAGVLAAAAALVGAAVLGAAICPLLFLSSAGGSPGEMSVPVR